MRPDLTAERLRGILEYEPVSGLFRWRDRRSWRAPPGSVAGSVTSHGYIKINVDQRFYSAHRLAWFYTTGAWPIGDIDHRDGNRKNNSWNNLRECSRSKNAANQKRRADNSSGFKGVSWAAHAKKWRAQIVVDGDSIHLGYHETRELARLAYIEATDRLNGQFARIE